MINELNNLKNELLTLKNENDKCKHNWENTNVTEELITAGYIVRTNEKNDRNIKKLYVHKKTYDYLCSKCKSKETITETKRDHLNDFIENTNNKKNIR